MPVLSQEQMNEFNAKAERIRKAMFLREGAAGNLKIENFVPATGIGKFDARYNPNTNVLDVTVNFSYDFQRDRNKPKQLIWTPMDKIKFRRKAKDIIENGWGNKFRMVSEKPGWTEFSADVNIHFNEVEQGKDAYRVNVIKIAKNKSSGGINHGVVPHVTNVNNFAVELDDTKEMELQFNFKEGLIVTKLKSFSTDKRTGDFIQFDANSITLSESDKRNLTAFCQYADKIRINELKGIKAFVYGMRGKNDSFFTRNLESGRTNAIVQWLNQKMPGGEFAYECTNQIANENWASSAIQRLKTLSNDPAKGNGGALIIIHTPADVDRTMPVRYIVIKHEFGHMIGLPDEYFGNHTNMTVSKMKLDAVIPETYISTVVQTGNERLQNMQENFVKRLEKADVPAPYFMGMKGAENVIELKEFEEAENDWYEARKAYKQKVGDGWKYNRWLAKHPKPVSPAPILTASTSIMHSGHEILKCHYITLWSALSKITKGYIQPNEWRIEDV